MTRAPALPPYADPLAYFLTWTTYGTWLPGDERGWVKRPGDWRPPDAHIRNAAQALLTEPPCVLTPDQRRLVEQTIIRHCTLRGWPLHAVNCRTCHVHVVLSAPIRPEKVRDQLKAWCTRRLRDQQIAAHTDPTVPVRVHWWTERGSQRWINDEDSLAGAVHYVLDCQ